ncbi:MAG: tetratricopeptide repeat protein, partial [Coleofasciculaceae cyanobacterium SM2_3_26]|nr:tetratricopeptide repeat protein [Coleofasciculaceae cyanobacterium SM2_3_26]
MIIEHLYMCLGRDRKKTWIRQGAISDSFSQEILTNCLPFPVRLDKIEAFSLYYSLELRGRVAMGQHRNGLFWYNEGRSLHRLGVYREAIASYDRALELQPNNYEVWYERGNSLRELGDLAGAIASYDRALAQQPDDYWAWYR